MSESKGYLGTAYARKDDAYFGGARSDFVALLPQTTGARVLELGCGNGATGAAALEAGRCSEYVGIEMFAPMAAIAAERLTRVHVGNVDEIDLPYTAGHFDALLMSEVLEHLVDPDATLKRLVSLVKPGGLVMASSPNVAHWRIIRELLFGRFTYAEAGPMDRTHLRWFTPASFEEMFRNAGVRAERVGPLGSLTGSHATIERLLGSRLRHLLWTQISFVGYRNPA